MKISDVRIERERAPEALRHGVHCRGGRRGRWRRGRRLEVERLVVIHGRLPLVVRARGDFVAIAATSSDESSILG